MTQPDRENSSAQGSTTVVNDALQEDKELLMRLSKLLYRIVETEAPEQVEKSIQAAPVDRASKGISVLEKQNEDSPLSGTKPPTQDVSAFRRSTLSMGRPLNEFEQVLNEFERKCTRLQAKLSQLAKALRHIHGSSETLSMAVEANNILEGVDENVQSCLKERRRDPDSPPERSSGYDHPLVYSLSKLARTSWSLSHSLADLCDAFLDFDCLAPLDKLALVAENVVKELQENANARIGAQNPEDFIRQVLIVTPHLSYIFDEASNGLTSFLEKGFPRLLDSQRHETSRYISMTGIAIFSSLITATLLASAVNKVSNTTTAALDVCWFLSLLFGIVSSVNSVLGLVWTQSSASSGLKFMPQFVHHWLRYGPYVSFALGAVLFSVGLCLFAFTASRTAAIVTTTFTAIFYTFLGILFVWFIVNLPRFDDGLQELLNAMRRFANTSLNSLRMSKRPASVNDNLDLDIDIEQGEGPTLAAGPPADDTDTDPHSHGNVSSDDHGTTMPSLAIPSEYSIGRPRGSSESSRSLPPLPQDAPVTRSMQYSPNGIFVCVGNSGPQERCMIFSADAPTVSLGEYRCPDIAEQIEWSRDAQNILLRFRHSIYIWIAMPDDASKRRVTPVLTDAQNVKWMPSGEEFFASSNDTLVKFDILGEVVKKIQFPSNTILDFTTTFDESRVICLVDSSSTSSVSSLRPMYSAKRLIEYNLEKGVVEQSTSVGYEACTLVGSAFIPAILVNFSGISPPQLWFYGSNAPDGRASTISSVFPKSIVQFKAPSTATFAGKGLFGGADDKYIICLGTDGDAFVFSKDSGDLLRHIHVPNTQFGTPVSECIAWDPDIVSFAICISYSNGSIWQWKASFDDMAHNSSAYAVVMLSDEDSKMIRAGRPPI